MKLFCYYRKVYITSITRSINMKLKDISNLTKNKTNLQFSLNLRVKQLHKLGITPEQVLNIKLPKNFKSIKDNLKNIPKRNGNEIKNIPKRNGNERR